MIARGLFVLGYMIAIGAYLVFSNGSAVRWHNVFVSVVGVISVFVFIGRFVQEKAPPRAKRIFLKVLAILTVIYGVMVLLSFVKGWYANAFFTVVFIAPMSALWLDCRIRERAVEQRSESSARIEK